MLKGSKKLLLSVRSVGRIPGGYVTNHVYTWVDPQGRSVSPPPDLPEHCSATVKRTESQRRSNMQLLQEGDEKKVREQSGGREGVDTVEIFTMQNKVLKDQDRQKFLTCSFVLHSNCMTECHMTVTLR